MLIQHQQTEQQGVFFCLDHEGNKIAELTYYFVDEKTINANHTYVSEVYPTTKNEKNKNK